ncbi:hypothetical protein EV424DRAFT_1391106 [Suillus variegatus]|nr:hypothetical protein EV424DRAFT_1391106 [Suillus variegatus]
MGRGCPPGWNPRVTCGSGATGYGLAWVYYPGGYGHQHPNFELPAGARRSPLVRWLEAYAPTAVDSVIESSAGGVQQCFFLVLGTIVILFRRENAQNMTSIALMTSLYRIWTCLNIISCLQTLSGSNGIGLLICSRYVIWMFMF